MVQTTCDSGATTTDAFTETCTESAMGNNGRAGERTGPSGWQLETPYYRSGGPHEGFQVPTAGQPIQSQNMNVQMVMPNGTYHSQMQW